MDQDLRASPVSKLVCSKCGYEMDVSGRRPFSQIICTQCGTELTIPVMLGQFLLVDRMGTGGMGSVYRALDTALNRFVAIKVMKSALGEDSKLVQSFITEAQAAAALNHPNIVQIYSCGTEKGQPYIVMELVGGGQMNRMFSREKPMDEVTLLRYASGVVEGLKAANEVGLVHGDIKPENILIDQKGTAKIVDFGLAQFVNAQKDRGEIWGTPYYISPERARGNKADHRSDIYSLGASMFHALSGQPPFDGKTAADVVLERLRHPPPNLQELRPELHRETVDLVNRMMAADPHLRYPNSASLKADIKDAITAARSHHGARTRKKGNRSSIAVAVIAAVIFIALGILFVRWAGSGDRPPPARAPVSSTPPPAAPDTPAESVAGKEPEEELFTVEEVTGADGKVRLKMTISFFDGPEEQLITTAIETLASAGPETAVRELQLVRQRMPSNSVRAQWIPVLLSIPYWAAGDAGAAKKGLEAVSRGKIDRADDHPAHMPRVISAYLLGTLSAEEIQAHRRDWPAWFGDFVDLADGVRRLDRGDREEGLRLLKAYMERDRSDPSWVYAFRPAVQQWQGVLEDWEDVQRRASRLLDQGLTGPARDMIGDYRKKVPPLLAGDAAPLMDRIARIESEQRRVESERAAALHRRAVQQDLESIDRSMTEVYELIMKKRDYRKAALSLSRLPASMKTDEGREAAAVTREQVEQLDALKNFIIKASDARPFTRAQGSDLGGDVVSANTLGVKLSLDGRSVSTRGWETIPLRSFIRLAAFYAESSPESGDQADAYTSLSVFCLMNGAFAPARNYATLALELDGGNESELRRLLPGLPIGR